MRQGGLDTKPLLVGLCIYARPVGHLRVATLLRRHALVQQLRLINVVHIRGDLGRGLGRLHSHRPGAVAPRPLHLPLELLHGVGST